MKHHLKKIAEHIRNEDCVFFIGAGISSTSGLQSSKDIAQKIAEELSIEFNNASLPELAEFYESEFKRVALIDFLRKNFDESKITAEQKYLYQIITKIPIKIILTTNYDNLLKSMSDDIIVINRNIDLWRIKENLKNIIKIHGDFDAPEELVITESDFIKYPDNHPNMMSFIEYIFSSKVIVFLGFGLRDLNTTSILFWLNKTLKETRTSIYSIMKPVDQFYKKVLEKRGVTVLEENAKSFLEELAQILNIDLAKKKNDLEFNSYYEPNIIARGDNSKIIFNLKNNTQEVIYCLSYRFEGYLNDVLIAQFPKHAFNQKIESNSLEIKPFKIVDPVKYYFRGKPGKGKFITKVYLEYRIGEPEDSTDAIIDIVIADAIITVK